MHKKILFLTIILLLTLTSCKKVDYINGAFAVVYKDDVPYLINKNMETFSLAEYDYIVPTFGDYLIVAKKIGVTYYYGYIDNTGLEIIAPTYNAAYPFSDGKAVVNDDGVTKIINLDNQVLYTFSEDSTSSASYANGLLRYEINQKYSYLNADFEPLTQTFDYAEDFSDGIAVVGNIIEGHLKYGFINKSGEFTITDGCTADFLANYHDGLARVGTIVDDAQNPVVYKYSYLNQNGELLTNSLGQVLSFDFALDFSESLAVVADYFTEEGYGTYKIHKYLDTNGEFSVVIPREMAGHGEGLFYFGSFCDGVARLRMRFSGAGAWHIIYIYDGMLEEAEIIMPDDIKTFDSAHYATPYEMTDFKISPYYSTNTALARVRIYTGEYSLIDSDGVYILPAEYSFLFY